MATVSNNLLTDAEAARVREKHSEYFAYMQKHPTEYGQDEWSGWMMVYKWTADDFALLFRLDAVVLAQHEEIKRLRAVEEKYLEVARDVVFESEAEGLEWHIRRQRLRYLEVQIDWHDVDAMKAALVEAGRYEAREKL